MRGVEWVREREPRAECFIVSRLDAYIMGFERYGMSKRSMSNREFLEAK